jgi:hypothetical protein
MKLKIEKSTYWFLVIAIINILYFPIVHFFLKNPSLGEQFKGMSMTFLVSYIYLAIGLIWLVFGALYLIADNALSFRFSATSKKLHFFLTLGFVIGLMFVPFLDPSQEPTGGKVFDFFLDILTFILPIVILAFLFGLVLFFLDLIKALVGIVTTK